MKQPGLHFTVNEEFAWKPARARGLEGDPHAIAVHPDDPKAVAIATSKGIYESTDSGESFNQLAGGERIAVFYDLDGESTCGTAPSTVRRASRARGCVPGRRSSSSFRRSVKMLSPISHKILRSMRSMQSQRSSAMSTCRPTRVERGSRSPTAATPGERRSLVQRPPGASVDLARVPAVAGRSQSCVGGDLAIGTSALLIALVITRARRLTEWNWRRIAALTAILGTSYTIFSGWMNLSRQSWRYSESMPVLRASGIEVGLSPLAQWLLIPPLALWLGRRTAVRLEAKRE